MGGVQWPWDRSGLGIGKVVKMGDVEEHKMVLGYFPLLTWGRSSGHVGEELRKRWHHFLPWHGPVKRVSHEWPELADVSAKALLGFHHSPGMCECLGDGTVSCLGNLHGNGEAFPSALSLGGS